MSNHLLLDDDFPIESNTLSDVFGPSPSRDESADAPRRFDELEPENRESFESPTTLLATASSLTLNLRKRSFPWGDDSESDCELPASPESISVRSNAASPIPDRILKGLEESRRELDEAFSLRQFGDEIYRLMFSFSVRNSNDKSGDLNGLYGSANAAHVLPINVVKAFGYALLYQACSVFHANTRSICLRPTWWLFTLPAFMLTHLSRLGDFRDAFAIDLRNSLSRVARAMW